MIAEYLGTGKANAVTAETLAQMLGCSQRDISQGVERERRAGFPICASCDASSPGYFLPEGPGELALYVASLNRRLRSTRLTLASMELTLHRMTGQESLWDDLEVGMDG